MCRWSGTCWVDAVREHCQYVYESALVGKMTWLKLSLHGSLLSTTRYTTYKLFLTVKVEFHLYYSLFHLPFTDIVAPTGLLSWLACCLPRDKKKQELLTSENWSVSGYFSWRWLRKEGHLYAPQVVAEKYASPLTTLLLSCDLPHIHYWSLLSVSWLPIHIHAASLAMQFSRNRGLWQLTVFADEVVR